MTSISALQSAVNGTTSTSSSSSTSSTSSSSDADAVQERFLKLLVAQMKNQDPLNPLDNAEVTSQMAQLSTVTGITQLNTTLEALQSSFTSSQSLEAANMIGHGVFVEGSSVTLYSSTSDGTTSLQGVLGANLSGAADSVTMTIYDSSGKEVYSKDLGAQSSGILLYSWDGTTNTSGTTATAGNYTFKITAKSGSSSVDATTLSFGEVMSVTNTTSGAQLNVQNIGAISMSDIVQIY